MDMLAGGNSAAWSISRSRSARRALLAMARIVRLR
jgi:hypothetical protein